MFAEDLNAFFDTAGGFAQYATLPGGARVAVIFDNGYTQGLSGMVETSSPSCQAATADVLTLEQGSSISIDSVSYLVAQVHPDGTGVTTLVLEMA